MWLALYAVQFMCGFLFDHVHKPFFSSPKIVVVRPLLAKWIENRMKTVRLQNENGSASQNIWSCINALLSPMSHAINKLSYFDETRFFRIWFVVAKRDSMHVYPILQCECCYCCWLVSCCFVCDNPATYVVRCRHKFTIVNVHAANCGLCFYHPNLKFSL